MNFVLNAIGEKYSRYYNVSCSLNLPHDRAFACWTFEPRSHETGTKRASDTSLRRKMLVMASNNIQITIVIR